MNNEDTEQERIQEKTEEVIYERFTGVEMWSTITVAEESIPNN